MKCFKGEAYYFERTVQGTLADMSRVISDDRQHLREAYLPVFIQDVRKLLE